MESLVTECGVAGSVRERSGPILANVSPPRLVSTADGKLLPIAVNQGTVFRRLAAAAGAGRAGGSAAPRDRDADRRAGRAGPGRRAEAVDAGFERRERIVERLHSISEGLPEGDRAGRPGLLPCMLGRRNARRSDGPAPGKPDGKPDD